MPTSIIKAVALICAIVPVIAQGKHPVKLFGLVPSQQRQDAIEALKSLRSITSGGISLQNYAPRVLDAKIKVDHYLESSKDPQPMRHGISVAMSEYRLSSSIWNASIFGKKDYAQSATNGLALEKDLDIAKCPAIAQYIQGKAITDTGADKDVVPLLWSCADLQIKEIDVWPIRPR